MLVYLIVNTDNGKVYVGQTIGHLYDRWKQHRFLARQGRKHHLYSAMREKPSAFKIILIAKTESQEALDNIEKLYVILFRSDNREFGYNLLPGGNGRSHSEETRRQLSESHKGKSHHTQEWREELSRRMKGNKFGYLAKGKPTRRGPHSEEHKENQRAGQIRRFSDPNQRAKQALVWKGRKHTEESKNKMREAHAKRISTSERCVAGAESRINTDKPLVQ